MRLTDPVVVPDWLKRAFPPAIAILLLWCAFDFLNWQDDVLPAFRFGGILWDAGTQRCFDNVEPFMPLAQVLHSMLCPASNASSSGAAMHLRDILSTFCLVGDVVAVFLTARSLSGWWGAGIAAAFAATSPFLYALDHQLSPAALGVLAATLSCWFAVEAFGRADSPHKRWWRVLWIAAAALALGLHAASAWLILAQAVFAVTRPVAERRPDFAVGVACVAAALAIGAAFLGSDSMTTAVARADVRGLPAALFAFSYPDEWMAQPHFAACLSVIVVVVLLSGAIAAKRTALPYFVAAIFVEQFVAAALSVDALTKLTSAAYAVPVMALTIGAMTELAIRRRPHMLAFVIPAVVVAAQYAAFGRLPLISYSAFDFDSVDAPPIATFASGDEVELYHDRHHADYVTVYGSLDGLVHGGDRRTVAATTAASVTEIMPYRVFRRLYIVYVIAARDGSWGGFVAPDMMWPELAAHALIHEPYAKVRLYDRTDVPYRGDVYATLEPVDTHFEVLDVNDAAYQPELHVRVADGPDSGRKGWIYAQTLFFGPAAVFNSPSR